MEEEATVMQVPSMAKKPRMGCATTAKERISKMPPCVAGKRSSIYRGVTRHRWTGRYEAHLWDKSTWNQNQNKKGKQVYLGAYDDEEAAARAYDLAALKYWGAGTLINFPVSDYSRDLEEMQTVSKEEYLVSLRRKSSAFSRGFPKCRGSSRTSQTSQLEASSRKMLDADYSDNLNFSSGSDSLTKKSISGGFCFERKIDLTNYIRWWIPKRMHHSESLTKSLDENYCSSEDVSRELRALECPRKPTEPYQLPSLGFPDPKALAPAVSACALLSRSSAFKNFQQKIAEMHEQGSASSRENDDDKFMRLISNCSGAEKDIVSLGTSDLALQRTSYSRSPLFLSMPLKADWNAADPVPDPLFWANLVPPAGITLPATIRKTDTTSYVYNREE